MIDTMKMMREGKAEEEIVEAQPSLAYRPGSVAYMKKLVSKQEAVRRMKEGFKPRILWFWGETGSGKSRTACEMSDPEKVFILGRNKKDGTPWFDGYEPMIDETVIFDDFRWDWFPFDELLRLLDFQRKH